VPAPQPRLYRLQPNRPLAKAQKIGEFLWSILLDIPETRGILSLDLLCAFLGRADCKKGQLVKKRQIEKIEPHTRAEDPGSRKNRSYYAARMQRPKCLSATDP